MQVGRFSPSPALFLSWDISSPPGSGPRAPGPDEPGLSEEALLGPRRSRAGHRAGLPLDLFALCFAGHFFLVAWGLVAALWPRRVLYEFWWVFLNF